MDVDADQTRALLSSRLFLVARAALGAGVDPEELDAQLARAKDEHTDRMAAIPAPRRHLRLISSS